MTGTLFNVFIPLTVSSSESPGPTPTPINFPLSIANTDMKKFKLILNSILRLISYLLRFKNALFSPII